MGAHPNISHDKFPKQLEGMVGKTVEVCFHYQTDKGLKGKIIRFDNEAPCLEIFQLEDGRVVLSTECQWRID